MIVMMSAPLKTTATKTQAKEMQAKEPQANELQASARRAIEIELAAVSALPQRLDAGFVGCCETILACGANKGRVVVTGMGKSGHIGKKIAATLASTGTPAMYVHPAEAGHGDLGMITPADVVLALSQSGASDEVNSLLPVLKRRGIPLLAITGEPNSALAQAANFSINSAVKEEACPLGLAPTSSTTAALVLGDALAMALLEARGFTRDDFAASHPKGRLGRRLLVRVEDIMHRGDALPRVSSGTSIAEALLEMSAKGFGLTTVVDKNGNTLGVFSDGDLRRALDGERDLHSTPVDAVMTAEYKSVPPTALAAEAARVMQAAEVYVLLVQEAAQKPGQKAHNPVSGIIRMHDMLQANVV